MTLHYYLNEIGRRYGKEETRKALNDAINTYDSRSSCDLAVHIGRICQAHFEKLESMDRAQGKFRLVGMMSHSGGAR